MTDLTVGVICDVPGTFSVQHVALVEKDGHEWIQDSKKKFCSCTDYTLNAVVFCGEVMTALLAGF